MTMTLGKRLSGLILVGLGAMGMVACLAGLVGHWIAAARLQQINSRLFGRVDELVVQVDQRAIQAQGAVGRTRNLFNGLKQTLQESAKDLLAERIASLPEIDNIQLRLESAMERSEELMAVSASTVELTDQLLATVGVVMSEKSADQQSSSDLVATIQSIRESLADASTRLADLQRRLSDIRQKRNVEINLSEIAKQSLGIFAKLDVVQTRIAALHSRLDQTKSRMAQLQNRISRSIVAGQCLIVLLIAWISAGQFCLLLQGRRLLRINAQPPRVSDTNSKAPQPPNSQF